MKGELELVGCSLLSEAPSWEQDFIFVNQMLSMIELSLSGTPT